MNSNIENQSFWSDTKSTATIIGMLSTVAGFISDVLNPLAPFATYIAAIALPLGLLLIITIIIIGQRWPVIKNVLPRLRLFALFTLFLGAVNCVFAILQPSDDEQKTGLLANKFEWAQSLQNSLGIIQQDISNIKKTTDRIEISTQKIEVQGGRIEEKVDGLVDSFAILTKAGGLISNPITATEWYYNSRIHQDKGDFGKARYSFNQYFELTEKPYYDPASIFKDFLITMEGRTGAAESLRLVLSSIENLPINIMLAELQEPENAIQILENLIKENKDYGPLNYALANQFTSVRQGVETLEMQQSERKHLKAFLTAHKDGKVLKHFIDQRILTKWLINTEERLAKTSKLENISTISPLELNVSRTNSNWTIGISIIDPSIKILFRYSPKTPLEDTGTLAIIDTDTGKRMPNYHFFLPLSADLSELEVYYIDANEKKHGPYKLSAELNSNYKATAYSAKELVIANRFNWITFTEHRENTLVYFTPLITGNCAIKEARYGTEKDMLNKTFKLGECNLSDPYRRPSDTPISITLPGSKVPLYVQVTYYDGSSSLIERFE